jgi:hypothetical protein
LGKTLLRIYRQIERRAARAVAADMKALAQIARAAKKPSRKA